MRRLGAGVALGVLVAIALAGCTEAPDFGVRLNDDNTIDFVICGSEQDEVEVNYRANNENVNLVEWRARVAEGDHPNSVVLYGESEYESSVLIAPPEDWVYVTANWAAAERNQLSVGEWTWVTGEPPFVPSRPCDGLSASELDG
jgi:hypothetical protein